MYIFFTFLIKNNKSKLMRSPCCLYMYPHMNFSMPETIFMKCDIYIMSSELISTAYAINVSHQSVLLGNGSVVTSPLQRIHQITENYWTCRFLCGVCGSKGGSVGLSVNSLIVARQRLRKHVPAVIRNCCRRRFLCKPRHIKGM